MKDGQVIDVRKNFLSLRFCIVVLMFMVQSSVFAGDVYLKAESAQVSSFDTTPGWAPKPDAGALIDGDISTRWASSAEDEEAWVVVDLGKAGVVSSIAVNWERAFSKEYDVLISSDNCDWEKVKESEDAKGGREVIEFEPVEARFVKIFSKQKINEDWGISIWEVEIYGPGEKNPEDKLLEDVYPALAKMISFSGVLEKESPLPPAGRLTENDFQKGVAFTSYHNIELLGEDSDRMIEHLKEIGVSDVALAFTWYQEEIDSTEIFPKYVGGNSAKDEAIIHAINQIHKNGMRVMLKPHVDCMDMTFRGDIIPSEEWFKSYCKFIWHFAELAQEYNVESLCIGTELEGTTYEEWDWKWKKVIDDARSVYSGKLTYAANWNEYEGVNFWNDLDFMGIDAYFPLTKENDPSQKALDDAWDEVAEKIGKYRNEKNIKIPLIFTEVGYQSADKTNKTPWYTGSEKEDQDEQAMCLKAMLRAMMKKSWFRGFYWWNYFPRDVDRPLDFTIKGKKAEKVLIEEFSKK